MIETKEECAAVRKGWVVGSYLSSTAGDIDLQGLDYRRFKIPNIYLQW